MPLPGMPARSLMAPDLTVLWLQLGAVGALALWVGTASFDPSAYECQFDTLIDPAWTNEYQLAKARPVVGLSV